jgi:hypothetical protein
VIRNPHIFELIKEASKFRDSPEASENLQGLLEKIEEISADSSKKHPVQTY